MSLDTLCPDAAHFLLICDSIPLVQEGVLEPRGGEGAGRASGEALVSTETVAWAGLLMDVRFSSHGSEEG